MQSGVNLAQLTWLCQNSTIPVLAAGGVATLEDIQKLYPLSRDANLEGVISGRALYTGTLDFQKTIAWLDKQILP